MSRDWDRWRSPGKSIIGGSNQNDIGETRASRGAVSDVVIERRPETQEGNFSFEIIDLSFKLFFGLACFLITLFASSSIASAVELLTRNAPHRFGIGISIAFSLHPGGRCTAVASHYFLLGFVQQKVGCRAMGGFNELVVAGSFDWCLMVAWVRVLSLTVQTAECAFCWDE